MNFYKGNGEKIVIESGGSFSVRKPWDIVLHRGWHSGVPENTIPAYHLMKENGYEWGEVDIMLTSDGVPVASHNSTVTGTLDGVTTTLTVAESTAAEVTALILATHDYYGEIHVPTLAELLDFARCYGIGLVLDVKNTAVDDVEEGKIFAQVVMESGWAEHCVYMPVSTTMAAAIQTIDHNASFDFVSAVNSLDKLPDLEPYTALLTGANTVGFDFNTNVPDAEGGIPDEVFAAVRAAGLSVSFWGISSSAYTTYFDKGPLRVTSGFANSGLGQMYLDGKQFW